MKAKGCITEVLEWRTAREYFYWRIRRRQAEEAIKDRLVAASNGQMTHEGATERVSKAMPAGMDDKGLVAWMEKNGAAVEALVASTITKSWERTAASLSGPLRCNLVTVPNSYTAKLSKKTNSATRATAETCQQRPAMGQSS